MKNKSKLIIASAACLLTAALIAMIRFVDAAPIGPQGTSIGLSHLNRFVFELFGVNMLWYEITDWLGFAALFTALLFTITGAVQLFKRRSIRKVDGEVLALGGLYALTIGLYIMFENAIVNYRPIIMPGCEHPEASFPSSHTMLVCVIMGSAMMLLNRYVRQRGLLIGLKAICAVTIAITVIGRLISGVHWFTDIIGALLISAALLALFSAIMNRSGRSGSFAKPGQPGLE